MTRISTTQQNVDRAKFSEGYERIHGKRCIKHPREPEPCKRCAQIGNGKNQSGHVCGVAGFDGMRGGNRGKCTRGQQNYCLSVDKDKPGDER